MVILSFLILIWIINSRIYDSIYFIQKNIIKNIHKLSFTFAINGTKDYSYHFKSEDILFYFDKIVMDEIPKEIKIYDQHIKILFDLNIYEYSSRFFDVSSKEELYSEKLMVDINFDALKFNKEYEDFSFGFQYKIKNIEKDISINFETIDKLNIFKYLIFEEKNEIYNNTTLLDFIKWNILINFDNEMNKLLVYYPECDSIYYFNSIIDYFKKEVFFLDIRINSIITINRCKISKLNYEEIIKDNRTIYFKNINATMYLELYIENYDGGSEEFFSEENLSLFIDYISIDDKKKIIYGQAQNYKDYALDALKLVINKTEEILEKKNI